MKYSPVRTSRSVIVEVKIVLSVVRTGPLTDPNTERKNKESKKK